MRNQIKLVNTALSKTLDLYRIWAKRNRINYHELLILYTLDDYEICTQKQICEWWALPKQTVHGILQKFEKQGYIIVTMNQNNKRERLIAFSEKGKSFASEILHPLYQMEERAMNQMREEQREQLISSNQAYYELLKKELEHES